MPASRLPRSAQRLYRGLTAPMKRCWYGRPINLWRRGNFHQLRWYPDDTHKRAGSGDHCRKLPHRFTSHRYTPSRVGYCMAAGLAYHGSDLLVHGLTQTGECGNRLVAGILARCAQGQPAWPARRRFCACGLYHCKGTSAYPGLSTGPTSPLCRIDDRIEWSFNPLDPDRDRFATAVYLLLVTRVDKHAPLALVVYYFERSPS